MTKDLVEAVKWYRSAATQGHARAQLALAGCYFRGLGVTKDYVEAYKWLSLSAAQGVEESTKLLPILERMMTPEQVLEGRQRAEPLFNSKKAPVDDKAESHGPANGSQPIRSETNRTSSAAGSRR